MSHELDRRAGDDESPWTVWLPEPAGHLDPEDVAAVWCVEWRRRRESEAA